jgi:hypothetical protein
MKGTFSIIRKEKKKIKFKLLKKLKNIYSKLFTALKFDYFL